jgi:DNA-binding NtrC family response regulator
MLEARRALVVASDPAVADRLVAWLSAEGHHPELCTSFGEAKPVLDARPPDLLVTELKLGAYNGLHLALRMKYRQPGVRTIVVGEADRLFEREAQRHAATYAAWPMENDQFVRMTRAMLPDPR